MYNNQTQIFLLHFAGGSTHSFDFLKKHVNSQFEFFALELPGRGKRIKEELLINKRDAIADYVNQIKLLRKKGPFIIYGHSMGATLGLSIVKIFEDMEDFPKQLIVSGNPGPGIEVKNETIRRYLMNDDDFKEELRKFGGIPEEVFQNKDIYDFFLPILRADFEILEKDQLVENNEKITTPIFAMMGDEEESHNKIENWKRFTFSSLQYEIFKGNHFFIYDYPKEINEIIIKSCIEEAIELAFKQK